MSEDPNLERRIRQTFLRTQPSTSKVSKSIASLLLHFNWRKVSLVLGNRTVWNQTAESLISLTRDNGIEIRQQVLFQEPYSPSLDISEIVRSTVMLTRSKRAFTPLIVHVLSTSELYGKFLSQMVMDYNIRILLSVNPREISIYYNRLFYSLRLSG